MDPKDREKLGHGMPDYRKRNLAEEEIKENKITDEIEIYRIFNDYGAPIHPPSMQPQIDRPYEPTLNSSNNIPPPNSIFDFINTSTPQLEMPQFTSFRNNSADEFMAKINPMGYLQRCDPAIPIEQYKYMSKDDIQRKIRFHLTGSIL